MCQLINRKRTPNFPMASDQIDQSLLLMCPTEMPLANQDLVLHLTSVPQLNAEIQINQRSLLKAL